MNRPGPLTFALLLLLIGVAQVIGLTMLRIQGWADSALLLLGAALLLTHVGLSFRGYRTLIRAVDAGYSSERASLAAVLLLFASTPIVLWGGVVISALRNFP